MSAFRWISVLTVEFIISEMVSAVRGFITEKRTVSRFAILEGIYWAIMGSFGCFLVAWTLDRGFVQSFIGVLLAIYLVSGFAGQFFMSSLCDRLRTNKKIFILGVFAAGISQLCMYFAEEPFLFAFFYGCYGFFLGPMGSILDAWMVRAFRGDMNAYSTARGMGSLGYAAVTLVMGQIIGRFGYFLMPICSTGFVFFTLILALITPDSEFEKNGRGKAEKSVSAKEIFSIVRVPAFLVILLVLFLTSMTSAPIKNFKIVLLRSVGGDITTQGWDSFIGCVVQFMVFEFAALFAKISARVRFNLSILLVAVALAVDYSAARCWTVILGTVIMNISYGLILPAVREIAIQMINPKFHTTAIGMMDAFYSFLGGAAAQLFAGRIVEGYGIKAMVKVCLILSLVPLVVLGIEQMASKGKGRKRCVNKCQGC